MYNVFRKTKTIWLGMIFEFSKSRKYSCLQLLAQLLGCTRGAASSGCKLSPVSSSVFDGLNMSSILLHCAAFACSARCFLYL